nr:MORC family CW-type zinc finger protein 3-like isoform X5 [Ziziphus jujuba var. spinosa]
MVKPYPVDASMLKSENYGLLHPTVNSHMDAILVPPLRASPAPHLHFEEPARRVDLTTSEETGSSKFSPSFGDHPQVSNIENNGRPKPHVLKQDAIVERNYVRADPSYLKTLGQAHSGWIFGAIAELVDNARDAKATKLEISIDTIYSKRASGNIPLLSIIDDGHGMTHQEIVRMTCFGHKQPEAYEPERIGRFGVGFKTGAMRLGRDALVLTQTANSRSIAFLSQSLNEGKDNLEIPIVSYRREGQIMEVDITVQSSALAKYNLKAIKEFSPFNKYLIGEKAALFCEGTGTQIYIWSLDKWGSDYSLEWHTGLKGGSSFHQGDILIRSRRIRSRPGQISQQVRLDYSLRSYMEVIFLVPRMKIYVQGSLVKSRPLEKSLNKTVIETGNVMGKHVQLTLGRCQLEWEQANCGIFLYWHGRLIEAYKRVGGMVHGADVGRGVIGVIDVTDVMDDGNVSVWVHSNKQGFQDSEAYALLEEWLGRKADEYWDNNFDSLQLKKSNSLYKPDQEWVQCDKCRKWRMLSSNWDSKNLPLEWFCYMEPFKGSCETPEQKVEQGVITVSAKRSGYKNQQKASKFDDDAVNVSNTTEGDKDDSDQDMEDGKARGLKRLRRGLTRACRKA